MNAVAMNLLITIQRKKKFPSKSKRNVFRMYDFPSTVVSLFIHFSHTM